MNNNNISFYVVSLYSNQIPSSGLLTAWSIYKQSKQSQESRLPVDYMIQDVYDLTMSNRVVSQK